MSGARENVTTLDGYQAEARRTINRDLTGDQRLMDAAAGLAEEAGEVLSHVRKHVMRGRTLDRDAVALELGDALWCLSVAADTLGVSLQDVARLNIEKLRLRYPD
ncbi:MAG TPA: nucleoside triphosphate pyrophosphohydrolase family protein [Gemmatimonadaceae bacterium]|jgi:NTP pyrophosphatase (non-canonical NTP hydrolase)|nr:nucleoside triphosphate pyrophosphohydrolase family protein [Gemmatimonadaceae bacterium]